jgi:hypothetical protein
MNRRILFLSVFSSGVATLLVLGMIWLFIPSTGQVLARPEAGAPTRVSYQGYLTDSGGVPLTGQHDLTLGIYAASSGGSPLWEDTFDDVEVTDGYFSVVLGSGAALTPDVFNGTETWLQVTVDGGVTPRQRIASVPYALQAQAALSANAAPWSGLTGVPAGFADGMDAGQYQNVKTVAKNCVDGGDDNCYLTIQAAINSVTDASATNRYLILVAPGTYSEQVQMKSYVDVHGLDLRGVLITRGGGIDAQNAATVIAAANSELKDVIVENTGNANYAVAVYYPDGANYSYNFRVNFNAKNGTQYTYGIYVNNARWIGFRESYLAASGSATATCYSVYQTGSNTIVSIYDTGLVASTCGANYGAYVNAGEFNARYSSIDAASYVIYNQAGIARALMSQLLNGLTDTDVTCAGVYDEAYAFYASTCP